MESSISSIRLKSTRFHRRIVATGLDAANTIGSCFKRCYFIYFFKKCPTNTISFPSPLLPNNEHQRDGDVMPNFAEDTINYLS